MLPFCPSDQLCKLKRAHVDSTLQLQHLPHYLHYPNTTGAYGNLQINWMHNARESMSNTMQLL